MSVLLLPIGLIPTTAIGWLCVRVLEWHTPVLRPLERWTIGAVLGLTLSMYWVFVLHVGLGLPLTLLGFIGAFALLLLPLAGVWAWNIRPLRVSPPNVHLPHGTLPRWTMIALIVVGGWTALRLLAMGMLLVATPTYFDDASDNWNLRGKVFFTHHEIRLSLSPDSDAIAPISSYPPAVPLAKTWLSTLAGSWQEPLVNGLHMVWYAAALVFVFCALRRRVSQSWALLGVYLLASLPLYLIHGLNAYADVFLSVHIFVALACVFHAASATTRDTARAFLRLAALATSILPFTKNEGLVLYLPPLLLVTALTLWKLHRQRVLHRRDCVEILAWHGVFLLGILGPWLWFKWSNGLTFGNAKGLFGFSDLTWQPIVFLAIAVNTFFEGNWLLLFPLFMLVLVMQWRRTWAWPVGIFTLFFWILYLVQMFAFVFTALSAEALMQTGYARGLIHLMPLTVTLVTLLLHATLATKKGSALP